jgi:hypothetical protein
VRTTTVEIERRVDVRLEAPPFDAVDRPGVASERVGRLRVRRHRRIGAAGVQFVARRIEHRAAVFGHAAVGHRHLRRTARDQH